MPILERTPHTAKAAWPLWAARLWDGVMSQWPNTPMRAVALSGIYNKTDESLALTITLRDGPVALVVTRAQVDVNPLGYVLFVLGYFSGAANNHCLPCDGG